MSGAPAGTVGGARRSRDCLSSKGAPLLVSVLLAPGFAGLSARFAPSTPAAGASAEASAALGKLSVTSTVMTGNHLVRFTGSWESPTQGCATRRRLLLRALVSYAPAAGATAKAGSVVASRAASVANCGAGRAGVVLGVPSRQSAMSCTNGSWQPGRYVLVAAASVVAPPPDTPDTQLVATARLDTVISVPC